MNSRTFKAADAHRLEDPERLVWLPPEEVVGALDLRPGEAVADIGAGTGYFALPVARAVGSAGAVFAVDFQTGMLDILGKKLLEPRAPANISLVHGTAAHTTLPAGCADLVFMANLWHELDDHGAVLKETARLLRSGGRLAIVDWRADLRPPPGPPADHRVAAETVSRSLEENAFHVERTGHVGKYGYLVLSQRRPHAP